MMVFTTRAEMAGRLAHDHRGHQREDPTDGRVARGRAAAPRGGPALQIDGICTRSWPAPPSRTPSASPVTGSGRRGDEEQRARDDADVQRHRRERGHQEVAVGVEDAHGHRRQPHEEEVGEHQPRQADGQGADASGPRRSRAP